MAGFTPGPDTVVSKSQQEQQRRYQRYVNETDKIRVVPQDHYPMKPNDVSVVNWKTLDLSHAMFTWDTTCLSDAQVAIMRKTKHADPKWPPDCYMCLENGTIYPNPTCIVQLFGYHARTTKHITSFGGIRHVLTRVGEKSNYRYEWKPTDSLIRDKSLDDYSHVFM